MTKVHSTKPSTRCACRCTRLFAIQTLSTCSCRYQVDGRCACARTHTFPPFSEYPDYYDEIKHPISLFVINRRMKCGEYATVQPLLDDLNRMFENAKIYNIEGSEIHEVGTFIGL